MLNVTIGAICMSNPIEKLVANDADGFRDNLNDILLQKIDDKINDLRLDVGARMFMTPIIAAGTDAPNGGTNG